MSQREIKQVHRTWGNVRIDKVTLELVGIHETRWGIERVLEGVYKRKWSSQKRLKTSCSYILRQMIFVIVIWLSVVIIKFTTHILNRETQHIATCNLSVDTKTDLQLSTSIKRQQKRLSKYVYLSIGCFAICCTLTMLMITTTDQQPFPLSGATFLSFTALAGHRGMRPT